jgi:hypothetical protein
MRTFFILLLFLPFTAMAQDGAAAKPDSTTKKTMHFSGYMEAYYCFDLSKPGSHERPSFFYNYVRHNEIALNLGYMKMVYNTERVRSNFTVMMGTYAQYNLYYEEELLKHVYEANVGFKISKKSNTWIDAGILPSHIGAESAIGELNWTLTRSIPSESTPFYEAGIKLSNTSKNEKWHLAAMYLNGWQRMQRIPGNQTPAFGTQVTYSPTKKCLINWSTFAGNDFPDTLRKWRYFSNLYSQIHFTDKFAALVVFDIGAQQKAKASDQYNVWYSPSMILQFLPSKKTRIAARVEYYADQFGVIIPTGTANGFKTSGYSVNFDYLPYKNAMIRVEARALNSQDKIFTLDGKPSNQNYFFTTSLSVAF